jgi:DNA-directed RNA polymerase specialized sigma24 family protein
MEKLDDEQRELIIQRYFLGRAQVELAAEAGVAASTITHRLQSAIESLRAHLGHLGCGAVAAGGLL